MATTATDEYQNYQYLFKPQVSFGNFHDQPNEDEFFLTRLTDFWTEVVKSTNNNIRSMLEHGAGPAKMISRFVIASQHVQSIFIAEYLEGNRKAVQDWISQDHKAFNWRPTFEYVLQKLLKLEGMSPKEVTKRETEVREKIKAVVPCDIKSRNPLQIDSGTSGFENDAPKFDVVSTCSTLEAVVESAREYKDHVAYLAGMVRPGGYLLMHGVLGQTFYDVGEKTDSFYLTKEMILKSMEDAGLKNIVFDLATSRLGFDEFKELPLTGPRDFFFVYGQASLIGGDLSDFTMF